MSSGSVAPSAVIRNADPARRRVAGAGADPPGQPLGLGHRGPDVLDRRPELAGDGQHPRARRRVVIRPVGSRLMRSPRVVGGWLGRVRRDGARASYDAPRCPARPGSVRDRRGPRVGCRQVGRPARATGAERRRASARSGARGRGRSPSHQARLGQQPQVLAHGRARDRHARRRGPPPATGPDGHRPQQRPAHRVGQGREDVHPEKVTTWLPIGNSAGRCRFGSSRCDVQWRA